MSIHERPEEAKRKVSDEELMRSYVAGDQAAFRKIFDRYAPRLLRLAERQARSYAFAQEIVQETFLRVHLSRNDFQHGRKLRPWLFTIATNAARDHWRKRRKQREVSIEDTQVLAEAPAVDPIERRERVGLLRTAVAQLPSAQREVIELHWFEELSFPEIARRVGARPGAVRVRAHRARGALRGLLAAKAA